MQISVLSQRFCDYSVSIKGYSKDTIRRYRQVISFYSRFAKITEIIEVTDENVRALFYFGRTKRKWSVNTFLCYYKSLKVFFRYCIQKEKCLQKNPIDEIEVPRLEKKLPAKLTTQDAFRLLEVVYNYPYQYPFLRYRNHAIFSTFLFAGLRKQELLNLKYADVDIENLTIFVRQGKGSKDRILPMSQTLAQSLSKYLAERRRLNKTNPEFFTSLRGNKPFTDSGLSGLVETIRKSSEINFTVHKLRHSWATMLLSGGCDIYSLSRMMGHANISTTTIYLYASADHLRSQIQKHPLNDR